MKKLLSLFLTLALLTITLVNVKAEMNCPINEEHFPDANFLSYVKTNFDQDHDGFLSQSEIDEVKTIYIHDEKITSLKGVELFKELSSLTLTLTDIEKLDLSANTKLYELYLGSAKIDALDLSQNKDLKILSLVNIKNLKSLDLSKNYALENLVIDRLGITKLDLSNNRALKTLGLDNLEINTLDLSSLDALNLVNVNYLPLKELSITSPLITSLYISNTDLDKIDLKNFKDLRSIDLSFNALRDLDTSYNPSLEYAMLKGNKLEGLDLTNNKSLKYLDVRDNNLAYLNLSNKPRVFYYDTNYHLEKEVTGKEVLLKDVFEKIDLSKVKNFSGLEYEDGLIKVDRLGTNKVSYDYEVNGQSFRVDLDLNVKKGPSVIEVSGDLNKTYDAKPISDDLKVKVKGSSGIVSKKYQVLKDGAYLDLDTLPKEAGEYRVLISVKEDDFYLGSSVTYDFKIAKAKGEVEILGGISYVYNGQYPKIEISTNNQEGRVTYSFEELELDGWHKIDYIPKEAGIYRVMATVSETQNYQSASSLKRTFMIAMDLERLAIKKDLSHYYDAKEMKVDNSVIEASHMDKVALMWLKDGKVIDYVPKDAGEYTLVAYVLGSHDYLGVIRYQKFEIYKAKNKFLEEVKVHDVMINEAFDFKAPKSLWGESYLVYSSRIDGEYTKEVPTKPGKYYVKALVLEDENYEGLESKPLSFRIKDTGKIVIPDTHA